jgi:hypothetical protein
MKTKTRRSRPASIPKTRWLAYATAGAATALAGANSLEASIHYSGRLDVPFPPHEDTTHTFRLDQAGDSIFFDRSDGNARAHFSVTGIVSAAFRGPYTKYVSKLSFGEQISSGRFASYHPGILEAYRIDPYGQWGDHGTGYVGFRFNSGAGSQYGWVRVKMTGILENGFRVLEYAYADPGEPITAGQRSADEKATEEGSTDEQAPDEGSLGGLALGAVGLIAWRKSRSRSARHIKPPLPV